MKTTLAALGLALLAAAPAAAAPDGFAYDPANDAVGRIYVYERSNTDGSMAEQIVIFRRSTTEVEVYKSVARCYGAALVTAEFDFETMTAPRITGGRLMPEAQHREFAFLTHDREASSLNIDVQLPDMQLADAIPVSEPLWYLYDFDFADMTLATPHLASPEQSFSFGSPLLWPDMEAQNFFQHLGVSQATPAGVDEHGRRYAVSGGLNGSIWLDAEDGHVSRVELAEPSHPGYADYQLALQSVSDGGAAEWDALLRPHYEGCEG
jgi:hypothetical protein